MTRRDPSRFPPCLCTSPLWSAGALASPRAALPSAPLFLAGLAALLPWLAAGFSYSFPVMGSWSQALLIPLHGPRWGMWQQTAMPSTSGAQQNSRGMEHYHHLLLSKCLDTDHVCTGGFPGLNAGWKGRGETCWAWCFLHSCLLFNQEHKCCYQCAHVFCCGGHSRSTSCWGS